ncbi:HNH endonuclease [Shewanella gelidimarina]|uniref:HNH endonuclease n=1 Tax=Shewanella gelidimarina TaxID=56813 RepID=UPI0020105618|nr:HNH endonuclease signature motif containing protein [Shewanella gelidimarina]MCL1056478.1 HNH endonuclease [Shewanella gelidimarina]
MKKLPIPVQNDDRHLIRLTSNDALTSINPCLRINQNSIKMQYRNYIQERGNAWNIIPNVVSEELKKSLINSYENRQEDELKFIKNMRDTHDEICSMCGGKFPWSLDHVLPKSDYPEWAIFSKNLVPACRCNIRRGTALKGNPITRARVLHPYFDDAFETRQISCLISTNNDFRWVKVEIVYLQPNHPEINSIKYHVENIVKRSGIEKYLSRTLWCKLVNQPGLAIRGLFEKGSLTELKIKELIEQDLRWNDSSSGTLNNWDSIFLYGILNSPNVLAFITQHHNKFVRNGGVPT